MKQFFLKISLFLLIVGLGVFVFEYFTQKISDTSVSLLCKNKLLDNDISKEGIKLLKDAKKSNKFLNSNICGIEYHETILLFSLVSAGIGILFGVLSILSRKKSRRRFR